METWQALAMARSINALGWAVVDQFDKWVSGEMDIADCNPNALAMIRDWLKSWRTRRWINDADALVTEIDEYLSGLESAA